MGSALAANAGMMLGSLAALGLPADDRCSTACCLHSLSLLRHTLSLFTVLNSCLSM